MKEGRINASAPVRIIFETEGINTSTICYAQQPGELGWCPTCKIGETNCTKKEGLKGNVSYSYIKLPFEYTNIILKMKIC